MTSHILREHGRPQTFLKGGKNFPEHTFCQKNNKKHTTFGLPGGGARAPLLTPILEKLKPFEMFKVEANPLLLR
jgi:hypothetical protein